MIIHLICLPKFCIRTVFNFSWDGCKIQEKLDDKALQNLAGVKGGGGVGGGGGGLRGKRAVCANGEYTAVSAFA